jgi:mannose-6-phosphate isomerase-like protein (cupin superfamily)
VAIMLVTRIDECGEFLAGDHTTLRELLRPAPGKVASGYSLAYGRLAPGTRSKRHRLTSAEVYYMLSGEGEFLIGHESVHVTRGSVVYVPPGAVQSLRNTGTTIIEFLCLVDPAWRPEDEEILE